jgi:hypothetical protein
MLDRDCEHAAAKPPIEWKPRKRSTPRSTIEAIVWAVREGGPGALQEPANIERLSRCDHSAKAEINQRIAKLNLTKERIS